MNVRTANPPNKPSATAETALPTAKGQPSAAAVMKSVGGSISGDDSQNAMTAEQRGKEYHSRLAPLEGIGHHRFRARGLQPCNRKHRKHDVGQGSGKCPRGKRDNGNDVCRVHQKHGYWRTGNDCPWRLEAVQPPRYRAG